MRFALFATVVACSIQCASCGESAHEKAGPQSGLPGEQAHESPGHLDASLPQEPAPEADAAVEHASSGLPCAVATVVREHCTLCHASSPVAGAPMPLTSHADFVAAAHSAPDKKVYELVLARVHNEKLPMPPVSQEPLSEEELATLDAWLAAGAPKSAETCADQR